MDKNKTLLNTLKEMEQAVQCVSDKHKLDPDVVVWMLSNIISSTILTKE